MITALISGVVVLALNAPLTSVRPMPRPSVLASAAICGDLRLRGVANAEVVGATGGCSISNPVRMSSVAGIPLSRSILVDCAAAVAMADWTVNVLIPEGDALGGVAQITGVGGFACRSIGGAPNGRLSEHSYGNAVDILGFTMENRARVTVLNDWGDTREGAFLARLADGACGIFGTVLGPNANADHADHFHFDVKERNSPYCR